MGAHTLCTDFDSTLAVIVPRTLDMNMVSIPSFKNFKNHCPRASSRPFSEHQFFDLKQYQNALSNCKMKPTGPTNLMQSLTKIAKRRLQEHNNYSTRKHTNDAI